MAKIGKFIRKTEMKTRVLSVLLVVAILCGSFILFGNNDIGNVAASGTEKKYVEHIIDRITSGIQDKFTVLEIVPYDGFGEFRYILNETEVVDKLESNQVAISTNGWCSTTQDEWKSFEGSGFGNFGYEIRYNAVTKDYEIKGNNTFQQKVFGEQAGILADKIELNTVEANDLTADMVKEADLIVFSTAPHDSGTIKLYEAWTGKTEHKFYAADGTASSEAYYDTYELVGGKYVTRDASWESCEALLDCTIAGRELTLSNGTKVTLKTPVILDNVQTSALTQDSNVYKFSLIYKTLCGVESIGNSSYVDPSDLYMVLKSNLSTTYNAGGATKKYKAANGNETVAIDKAGSGVFDASSPVLFGPAGGSVLNDFYSGYNGGIYSSNILNNCFESKYNTCLTDHFFSYAGDELIMSSTGKSVKVENKIYVEKYSGYGTVYAHYWKDGGGTTTTWPGVKMDIVSGNTYSIVLPEGINRIIFNNSSGTQTGNLTIPTDGKNYYNLSTNKWSTYDDGSGDIQEKDYSSFTGVTKRTGSTATISEVLQFLLGTKKEQVATYNYDTSEGAIKVLEVQPCTSFSYNTFEKVKELGKKLLMSGADSWTSSNYKKYLDVTCVTTNALNGMVDDLVADYDIIIIGENSDILLKDSQGNTIYNDRTLNGYVYLAFGDVFKIATNALGLLPDDYEVLQNSSQESYFTKLSSSQQYKYTDYVYSELTSSKYNGTGKVFLNKLMQDYYKKGGAYDSDKNGFGNSGGFYSDYKLGNVRGADNDITDKTKEKLELFAKSGKTIILSDSLYDLDGCAVYPTSDMYDFCETLAATDANGKRLYSVYSMEQMSGAVNHRSTLNPEIKMTEYPTPPSYTGGVITTFGSRDIDFKFKITPKQTAKYRIKLYVDKNSDGVYKGIEEGISDDRNELYFSRDVQLTANNEVEYLIDSQLSDNFIGMLAWKIEIVQLDSSGNETAFSDSVKGYSAIKNEDTKIVNVLQIMPDNNPDSPVTLNMQTDSEFRSLLSAVEGSVGYEVNITSMSASEYEAMYDPDKGGTAYNGVAASGGYVYFKNNGNWSNPYAHYWNNSGTTTTWPGKKMLKVTDDIYAVLVPENVKDIIFSNNGSSKTDNITLQGKNKLYSNGSWSDYKYYDDPDPTKPHDYLATYDMVVIGFADRFGASGDGNEGSLVSSDISNKYGALDNLTDFINDGRAVLFTHDTISWRVTPNYEAQRAEEPSLGRLQMYYSTLLKADGTFGSNSYHDDFAHHITVSLRDRVGLDKYGITLKESDRDGHESPIYASATMKPSYTVKSDSNGNYHVEELQGFTPWFIYRNNFLHAFYSDYSYDSNGYGMYSLKPFKSGLVSSTYFDYNKKGAWTTTKVAQLNEGSITMYPYDIDEKLTVEKTHAQYYSINMEDEDVVVWYTLAADGISDNKSEYYGLTDKDAENNYYIYSKNNITYSGAGHQVMTSQMEKKLFVNTLIKAIAGGNSTPVLTVTNGAIGSGSAYVVYVNSANPAEDYDIHILATDADLVSPQAAGIDNIIRESDLPTLKAQGINVDVIGRFKWAEVYWKKPDDTEVLIKRYDADDNPLRNGVITELMLGDTKLKSDTGPYYLTGVVDNNGNKKALNALSCIEYLVEGIDGADPMGANFIITVSDWLGATKTINVRLVKRDLFQLE